MIIHVVHEGDSEESTYKVEKVEVETLDPVKIVGTTYSIVLEDEKEKETA